jgi:hypothetical protein
VNAALFDPREILLALARHAVSYVVVGGIAVQAHGGQRLTQDLPAALGKFALWRERAHEVDLGDVAVPVAARADLIAMKRSSGRPQDLEDVDLLEGLPDN